MAGVEGWDIHQTWKSWKANAGVGSGRASSMLGMKSRPTQSDFHTALHFPTLESRGQQAPPRNLTRVQSLPTLEMRLMQNSISENTQLILHNIDRAWRRRLSDCPWDEDPIPKNAWENDRYAGCHWLDLCSGGAPIGPPGNVTKCFGEWRRADTITRQDIVIGRLVL